MLEAAPQPAPEQPKRKAMLRFKQDDKPANDVERLKLALWFIGKCGDEETAERVFRAAIAATKELRTPVRS